MGGKLSADDFVKDFQVVKEFKTAASEKLGLKMIIVKCSPEIRSAILGIKKIFVGCRAVFPKDNVNPIKCFNCYRYGHKSANCYDPTPFCGGCFSHGHPYKDCKSPKSEVECPCCFQLGAPPEIYAGHDMSPDSHNAILKIADERRSAVIIMPEPNLRFCQFRNYFLDKREDVAAFTTPHLTGACREWRSESGFLSFVHNDMFFGVYVSPNCPISVFESFLLRLEQAIHSQQLPVILSGDFNARSAAWGDRADVVCTRGRRLEEWVMANDLVVHNDSNGKIPSFSSSNGQSFIDLGGWWPFELYGSGAFPSSAHVVVRQGKIQGLCKRNGKTNERANKIVCSYSFNVCNYPFLGVIHCFSKVFN
ncbi:hypothetical protein BC332_34796 [Capsicum chinense]|nr:hypothetical protein BC332_34796 [Capsicum chinense]